MPAKKANLMLLKIGDGADPEGFTAIGGLRTRSLSINAEQVDVTSDDDTERWRQLLAGAGVKSVSISGSGVFKNDAAAADVRTEMFAQLIRNWQLIVPDFGTFQGPFQVASLEYAGEHNGEVTYSVGLESAGNITFTA